MSSIFSPLQTSSRSNHRSQWRKMAPAHAIHDEYSASGAHNPVLRSLWEIVFDHRRNLTAPLSLARAQPSSPCIAVLSYRVFPACLSPNTRANHVRKMQKPLPVTQKWSFQADVKLSELRQPREFPHRHSPYERRKRHPLLSPESSHDDGHR